MTHLPMLLLLAIIVTATTAARSAAAESPPPNGGDVNAPHAAASCVNASSEPLAIRHGNTTLMQFAPDGDVNVTGVVHATDVRVPTTSTTTSETTSLSAMLRALERHRRTVDVSAVAPQRSLCAAAFSTLIAHERGGWTEYLSPNRYVGSAVAALPDLDGDGVAELAVGEPTAQRVHVLMLDERGGARSSVRAVVTGTQSGDDIGVALAAAGDVDGDGVPDLLLGVPGRNTDRGTVAVLMLRADGTTKTARFLDVTALPLSAGDRLGAAVALVPDVDGDGVDDVVVGVPGADAAAPNGGGVRLLLMNAGWSSISAVVSLDVAGVASSEALGTAVAALSDLDGDGAVEIVASAPGTTSAPGSGLHVFFLSSTGPGVVSVRDVVPLATPASLGTVLAFGRALATVPDVDGDGVPELTVGAYRTSQQPSGVVAVLMLRANVSVKAHVEHEVAAVTASNLDDEAPALSGFGSAITVLPDRDSDGLPELAVGAPWTDEYRGAVIGVPLVPMRAARVGAALDGASGDDVCAVAGAGPCAAVTAASYAATGVDVSGATSCSGTVAVPRWYWPRGEMPLDTAVVAADAVFATGHVVCCYTVTV